MSTESHKCQHCFDNTNIGAHLEDLVYARIFVINSGDFDHGSELGAVVKSHVAPDCE